MPGFTLYLPLILFTSNTLEPNFKPKTTIKMENAVDVAALGAAILAGTQLLMKLAKGMSGQVATIIVAVLFSAIAFFINNGLSWLELFIAIAGQVVVYDFVVKPVKEYGTKP